MRLGICGESVSKNIVDGGFSASYWPDCHKTVTYERCLVKLNDLYYPRGLFNEVCSLQECLNTCFDFLVDFFRNVCLPREDISNERLEKWLILSDEL